MPDFDVDYDPKVAIPTLVGSALSCFATTCVLLSWMCCSHGKRSFRYALIMNLTFAEWVNSTNNTVSGAFAVMHRGVLMPGSSCTFNGWIGQMSVQAADFSILAIALVTLFTIKLKSYILHASFDKKILICLSVWLVPLATSTTAVAMHQMKPVSGNWCWISSEKTDLRYALGHGWRFGIIAVTVAIYIYVFVYMKNRLSYLQETSRTYSYDYGRDLHDLSALPSMPPGAHFKDGWDGGMMVADLERQATAKEMTASPPMPSKLVDTGTGLSTTSTSSSSASAYASSKKLSATHRRKRSQGKAVEREIWRMLLLNAYPIMYVVLWLPGILNRVVEATGRQYEWLQIMQCSTQYIGLANALTYGFKEHRRDFAEWIGSLHR